MSLTEKILILDFGSQVTQLIARRLREINVYCEIHPFTMSDERVRAYGPNGIILSGGPCSVLDEGSPRAPQAVFDLGVPVLGVCYGQQTMMEQLGGKVESGHHREFGRASVRVQKHTPLLDGWAEPGAEKTVWMSHGDRVTAIPPGFEVVGTSSGAPFAAIADEKRHFYAVQFHPEVYHTENGVELYKNFCLNICGLSGNWSMAAYKDEAVAKIRAQVGDKPVLCGLSGGVDS